MATILAGLTVGLAATVSPVSAAAPSQQRHPAVIANHVFASAASATSASTGLPLNDFGRMLVDPTSSHVFVSSLTSSEVVALDFSGNIAATIPIAGAGAMAVNGTTLYVAQFSAGTIDRIDTTTLKETSPLPMTALPPLNDLIFAANKLWTAAGWCGSPPATPSVQLVSIDPSTNPATETPYPGDFDATNGLGYCAMFANDPATNPSRLLAWGRNSNPATLVSYDLSAGSPVQKAIGTAGPGLVEDLAISADGSHAVAALAPGDGGSFPEWNMSNLQPDGTTYPANPEASSVATSAANGGLVGGGICCASSGEEFTVFLVGQPVPLVDLRFGLIGNDPLRGVEFSPDGSKAFVISGSSTAGVIFNVIAIPNPGPPQPPSGVFATPGIDSALVTWRPPTDQGGYAVTSYAVTTMPGDATTIVNAPATSVLLPLNFGTTYTFTVTATNRLGTSGASSPSNSVNPNPRPPGPPLGVFAVPYDSAAVVGWSAPVDLGEAPPITDYLITASPPSSAGPFVSAGGANGSPPATQVLISGLINGTTYTFTVQAGTHAGPGVASAPSNAVTPIQGGNFHPLVPNRILDTRSGIGGIVSPLHNLEARAVQITGQGGVPRTGVTAVVLNVTVANATSSGYLTVYPSGVSRPTASNLNFVAGETVPNLVEVAIGNAGQVDVFTQFAKSAGTANVIFDVAGWVGDASGSNTRDGLYNPLTPARILDTRSGLGAPARPLGPNQSITLQVTGQGGVPASGVEAVILNVTVTQPTSGSYLTVYPSDAQQRPTASNLNFVKGETVPNRVIVKLSAAGTVNIYNASGSVQVIADVGGWFTDATSTQGGTRLTPLVPFRIFDSRDPNSGGPWGPADTGTLQVVDQNGQPATDVSALVVNVTVTNTSAASYLTLWPDGSAQPLASDLNWVAGETVPNLVVVKLGANATLDIYNALGSTDVVIDLVGYYGAGVAAPAGGTVPFRLSPFRLH